MSTSTLLARSARYGGGHTQTYDSHIEGVMTQIERRVREIENWTSLPASLLGVWAKQLAAGHDVGKIEPTFQQSLHLNDNHPTINHVDGGVALFEHFGDRLSALVVSAHHGYLKNYSPRTTLLRDHQRLADRCPHVFNAKIKTSDLYDLCLEDMCAVYKRHVGDPFSPLTRTANSTLLRLLLSLLVTADHSDAACHQGREVVVNTATLRPTERLESLNTYRKTLKKGERAALRNQVYESVRTDVPDFTYLNAAVGSGKTMAVFNYALRSQRRRVFVVQPHISLIRQTATVGQCLAIEGEDVSRIVSECHHLVVSDSDEQKHYTSNFQTPVVVTTYCQFFNTLFGNSARNVKRLHEFVGSHIIVDEVQLLPGKLWPLVLKQLKELVANYGCKVTFVSGTMVRPWDVFRSHIDVAVHPLIPKVVSDATHAMEKCRIRYSNSGTHSIQSLVASVWEARETSSLVICNTKKRAASVALEAVKVFGKENVYHISTALTAHDRDATVGRIVNRLSDSSSSPWITVATTVLESGVDLSFAGGWRESASPMRVVQTSGRVNRHGEREGTATLRVFTLYVQEFNPFAREAAWLNSIWQKYGDLTEDAFDWAFRCDLDENNGYAEGVELLQKDDSRQFEFVAENSRIIEEEDTLRVLVGVDHLDASKGEFDRRCITLGVSLLNEFEKKGYILKMSGTWRQSVDVYQGPYSPLLGCMAALFA